MNMCCQKVILYNQELRKLNHLRAHNKDNRTFIPRHFFPNFSFKGIKFRGIKFRAYPLGPVRAYSLRAKHERGLSKGEQSLSGCHRRCQTGVPRELRYVTQLVDWVFLWLGYILVGIFQEFLLAF